MPAKDFYHEIVINALKKEDWKITDDPLTVHFGDIEYFVDLGAEKIIIAEKKNIKIAVEVKSFLSDSPTSEFHSAIGQYINYREALQADESDRFLYLAVTSDIYQTFMERKLPQKVIQKYQIKLLIFDSESEVILKWIN
ncbi:XisH protein [Candidatus Magnetomorum sp. HK-1]|nr:XisH protein [Candidatus Magnetomorum sp. HK-1]